MSTQAEGYRPFETSQLADQLAIAVHTVSLKLPSHECSEESGQIRLRAKSFSSGIVKGSAFGRYNVELVCHLFGAYGSHQETINHIEMLFGIGSLSDKAVFDHLHAEHVNSCSIRKALTTNAKPRTP